MRQFVISILLFSSFAIAAPVFAAEQHNPVATENIGSTSKSTLTHHYIIEIGFGYGVKIDFIEGTSDEVAKEVMEAINDVVESPEIQNNALKILAITMNPFAAAKYIFSEIAKEVVYTAIKSIEIVKI